MISDIEPKLTMMSLEVTASAPGKRQFVFLVYADDDLVGVLTQSQHAATVTSRRSWILEAAFGPCSGPGPTVWHDLAEFYQWVLERCCAARVGSEPYLRRWAASRSRSGKRAGDVDEGYAGWDVQPARKVRPEVQ
jgi:hypothetical protein